MSGKNSSNLIRKRFKWRPDCLNCQLEKGGEACTICFGEKTIDQIEPGNLKHFSMLGT